MTETLILRTRPTTVEAKRVAEDNRDELARWVSGWTYAAHAVRWFDTDSGRVASAVVGDWIVKTAFGQFKPQGDASIFSQYDRVTAAVSE